MPERRPAARPVARRTTAGGRVVRERPPVPVVLDTSALIGWTLLPSHLSRRAASVIADAVAAGPGVVVSAISLWEIGLKVQQGRLDLGVAFDDYVARLDQVAALQVTPVSAAIWLRVLSLDWAHRDPADRVIVATADLLDAPLATSDRAIRAYYRAAVW